MSSGCSEGGNNNNYSKPSLPVQLVLTVVCSALWHPPEIRCHIVWL